MVSNVRLRRWTLLARGLVASLIGIAALTWPATTASWLVYLFGAYVLLHGILSLAQALGRETESRWLFALEGLADLGGAIAAFVWPDVTGQAVLYVIAGWAITVGLVQIAGALWQRKARLNDRPLMLGGLASVVFGLVLAIAPGIGAQAVTQVIGAFALVSGTLDLVLGFRLRSITKHWGDSHHELLS